MNRDPFDTLRSRNPHPPQSLPDAPMEMARRITAGRPSVSRGLAIAAAAAAVVLVAGGGWLLWTQTGGGRDVAGPATTTTLPGDATTTSYATTTTLVPEAPELVIYLLDDGALMPVARDLRALNVLPVPEIGRLAMELLVHGMGAWDAGPLPGPVADAEAQLTTAIPEGTALLGLTIADGVATVDLSAEFAAASPQAIAQVVYTLTGLDGVTEAGFAIEGAPQVLGSLTSGLYTPYLEPADTGTGMPSVGRAFLAMYQSDVMIEHPALGGTLRPGEAVTLLSRLDTAGVALTLTASDGTLLWNALAAPSEPAYLAPDVLEAAGGYGVWATLRAEATASDGSVLHPSEIPVWLEPGPPSGTVTEPVGTPAEVTYAGEAPWAQPPLAASAVPAVVGEVWSASDDQAECPMLFPADPASLAGGADLHERYFSGNWGLAWDLASGPGRWEPGGLYCADCGREAFGVAGVHYSALEGTEDSIWPRGLSWSDGSHAGYGFEGVTSGNAGEPTLAYLFVGGRDCMYNVWSYLGEDHLLALISQLRFVEGMTDTAATTTLPGLGGLTPYPPDMSAGCAPETARDLAAFEAAFADGRRTLADLCSVLGLPDWLTGSGLWVPVYDLGDGSRLYLGYNGPGADNLLYARIQSPDGTVRQLLEP